MLRYYEERAKGGAGLVTIEATSVDPTGNSFSRGLSIANDARLPGLTDLARRVKRHGARISIQLQHGGRAALPQFSGHAVPLVSAIPGVTPYDNSVILSEEEIARLVECWGKAAIRAREAGFDAVEIHGAHGYLISQFLSPYTNRRTDGYGGSLENRMRFALEVCRKVRESVGPDFPVTYRMSAVEGLPGGTTLEDSVALAKRLVADGIDALHVSVGLRETNFMVSPPACVEKGWNAPLSRAVRDGIEAAVPVIVAGRVADEQTAQGHHRSRGCGHGGDGPCAHCRSVPARQGRGGRGRRHHPVRGLQRGLRSRIRARNGRRVRPEPVVRCGRQI